MKTLLVTVRPRSCPLCYRCRKKRFLPGLFRCRAGALVYHHGGVVGGGGLFRSVGVPPATSSAARTAAPGLGPLSGSYNTYCVNGFIVACSAKTLWIPPRYPFWYLTARFLCRNVQYNQEISLFIIQPSCVRINDLPYLCCQSAV